MKESVSIIDNWARKDVFDVGTAAEAAAVVGGGKAPESGAVAHSGHDGQIGGASIRHEHESGVHLAA